MHKILLVDDDRELTSLLKELLEMEGFNVVLATDGELVALKLLDASIDLLLLDIMMPRKNGIGTHLKSYAKISKHLSLYVNGRGSDLDRVLGSESWGADDYLPKAI